MKKTKKTALTIIILVLSIFAFTACGTSGDSGDSLIQNEEADIAASAEPEEISTQDDMKTNLEEATDQETSSNGQVNAGTTDTALQTVETEQSGASTEAASVIVKSDNIVTNAEKQQVLTELNGEIDDLLESLNQLDEVDESELEF